MDKYVVILLSCVFILLSSFLVVFILILNRRTINHKTKVERINKKKQRDMISATIQAQEEERARIGANIHDDIGPNLSLIKYYITKLKSDDSKSEEEKAEIISVIDETIHSVRSVSQKLVPTILYELGLVESIESLIQRFESSSDLTVIFNTRIKNFEFSPKLGINIFRIVQESLANILKHAEATEVRVSLLEVNGLLLRIEDNGVGFDIDQKAEGLGLYNIQARAVASNGSVTIKSDKGIGTQIEVFIEDKE